MHKLIPLSSSCLHAVVALIAWPTFQLFLLQHPTHDRQVLEFALLVYSMQWELGKLKVALMKLIFCLAIIHI